MYKKQAQLKAVVASCLGAVILFASSSYDRSQSHVRQLSAISGGGENFADEIRSLFAKIHSEGAADIWLVNQPKCGTGYLQHLIMSSTSLDCKPFDAKEETRFIDCGNDKLLFRSHSVEKATTVKTLFDLGRSRSTAKVDRCLAITAVRNPLQSIPSMFFQSWSSCDGDSTDSRSCNEQICDGTLPVEDVVKMYEMYLATNMPANQALETAKMLRIFSGDDIDLYQAFSMLAEKGVAFFNETDPDGPWAGCELMFLQIDHDAGTSVDQTMRALFPGEVESFLPFSRSHHCPNAAASMEAIYSYELTDQHVNGFAQTNPEMRDLFRYYRENPTTTPAQTEVTVS